VTGRELPDDESFEGKTVIDRDLEAVQPEVGTAAVAKIGGVDAVGRPT